MVVPPLVRDANDNYIFQIPTEICPVALAVFTELFSEFITFSCNAGGCNSDQIRFQLFLQLYKIGVSREFLQGVLGAKKHGYHIHPSDPQAARAQAASAGILSQIAVKDGTGVPSDF